MNICVSKILLANIVLFFWNIIIDLSKEMRYIDYRLDHGSQVGNSNSEEFPFYTSKNPGGMAFGVLAVCGDAYDILLSTSVQRNGQEITFLPD